MPTVRIVAALLLLSACAATQTRRVSDEEVRRVHASALLIDTHNDVTSETVKGLDIGIRRAEGHSDVPRLREGGVKAVFFAAYVSSDYGKQGRSAHRALEMIHTIRHDIVGRYPKDFELALSADGIEAAARRGRIAALIGIEGGHALEDSTRLLGAFYDLGVRYMTLTHTNHTNWADSAGSAGAPNGGLNERGREIIREMNRLGMMVDVSHVSDATFRGVLEASRVPVIASHSSCRALSRIVRNMTDGMIRALAAKGGVIQINFGCEFLSQASADTTSWTNPAIRGKNVKQVRARLADVVAHIQHAVKIGGIDAVGIGSDFDGVSCTPEGLDDVARFPALTRALLEAGFTGEQIHKIYGGNLMRVFRAVEAGR